MAFVSRISYLSFRLSRQNPFSSVLLFQCSGNKSYPWSNIRVTCPLRLLQSSGEKKTNSSVKLSKTDQLKKAVRDYGATIIVFHVAISLTSLGISYLAISNGIDAVTLLQYVGFPSTIVESKVAVGGSTFVIAYAVHKLFAPARIAITVSAAPFIVRYLRRIQVLKPPKP